MQATPALGTLIPPRGGRPSFPPKTGRRSAYHLRRMVTEVGRAPPVLWGERPTFYTALMATLGAFSQASVDPKASLRGWPARTPGVVTASRRPDEGRGSAG